jgi:hypothetical protein
VGSERSVTSVLTVLTVLTSCTVAPLTNKIKVGEEPFVIGVGEGSDSLIDLYAALAVGGSFYRLTFNRGEERLPELSPSGIQVAFIRRNTAADPWSLVVLDLRNNREVSTPLPRAIGDPTALGWSEDDALVVVRGHGSLVTSAPPGALWPRSVSLDSVRWADSLTSELVGSPPTARIAACSEGACVIAESDTTQLPGATGAIRWGPDSLGYLGSAGWEIRPLAGGRVRRPDWKGLPANLREITYHMGKRASSPP